MAGKLRSITSRIPWSSVLKAAAVGTAWFLFSWWAFALIALFLYMVPVFAPGSTRLQFASVLSLGYVLPASIAGAAAIALLFFLTLGIKDLVFVDRGRAKEFFLLVFLFAALLRLSSFLEGTDGALPAVGTALGALFVFLLVKNFLAGEEERSREAMMGEIAPPTRAGFGAGVVTLLAFELMEVATALPMNFFYATAIAFAGATALVEYFADDARGRTRRAQTFFYFAVFFVVLIFVLVTNAWRP